MKLKETRRWVTKSLFFSTTAVKEAREYYEAVLDDLIGKLEHFKSEHDEPKVQEVYKSVGKFKTHPWEILIHRRPSRKPIWCNRHICPAPKKRRYLARIWHQSRQES